MSVTDFNFGGASPANDALVQKQWPGVQLNGTELSGEWSEVREIQGSLWSTINATWNPSLLGFSQVNPLLPSYAQVLSSAGLQYKTAIAGATSPIVWATTTTFGSPLGLANLKDYGATGNGVTDDTAAIQAWLNVIQTGVPGWVPEGTYLFTSQLTIVPASIFTPITILGAGQVASTFIYGGASTTIDCMLFGNNTVFLHACTFRDWGVTSTTVMTAGYLLHLVGMGESYMTNIAINTYQYGLPTCYNGVFFDGVNATNWTGIYVGAKNNGITVAGTTGGGNGGLYLTEGLITNCGGIGLYCGGNYGGLYTNDLDVIANNVNFRVDNAINAATNREIFFGPGTNFDTAVADNVVVATSAGTAVLIAFTQGWISNSGGYGLWLQNTVSASCFILLTEAMVWQAGTNSGLGHLDGIRNDSLGAMVQIVGGWVRNNAGYGINATTQVAGGATTTANVIMEANVAGNLSANMQAYGGISPVRYTGNASNVAPIGSGTNVPVNVEHTIRDQVLASGASTTYYWPVSFSSNLTYYVHIWCPNTLTYATITAVTAASVTFTTVNGDYYVIFAEGY
jgi:hypothetical protein